MADKEKISGTPPAPENKNQQQTPPAPAASEHSAPAAGEEMVQVPASLLAEIREQQAAMQNEIQVLRDAAPRGKLQEAEDSRRPMGPPRANLMVHDGKVVVGWKMEKNEMVYNPVNMTIPVSENLKIRLFYMDGKDSGQVPYVEFIRTKERANVFKVGEKEREYEVGGETRVSRDWIIKFEDPRIFGDEYQIDPQFLNPA